jgi:predicted amidohydrolase YtcJ
LAERLSLAGARGSGWLRGVGYHESVAGPLDRDRLDAWVSRLPLRVQHRSGALWILNSPACRAIGLDAGVDAPGVERDASGRATGRLFRLDAWLREQLGAEPLPDLAPVGALLARYGVTGVSDATPALAPAAVAALAGGALPQQLVLLGADAPVAGAQLGPLKLLLDERALPPLAQLVERIRTTHAQGRCVAVHCVTRAELVLTLAAFEEAGVSEGDRIEHASVAPPEGVAWIARLGLTVVTQPGFVHSRGDAYLREVEPRDRAWLYRCAGFTAAGVALGAGTDAPFGEPDPWLAMQAAVDRRSAAGATLGAAEALSPERALALFSTPADAPGGAPRQIALGAPADLCLLDRPWARARDTLTSEAVLATVCAGRSIYTREPLA